jgi:carbon-monoxide dehydrogenase small subunit
LKKTITLHVNGDVYELSVEPNQTLLDVLREELALTGTKKGCDSGACGACTVIVDGEPILSCMTFAVRCQTKEILTIEGLAEGTNLHPIQEAFIKSGAIQCGYCTPGMVLSAKALLDENPFPSEEEVRLAIAGNFCRCTGYKKIVAAVLNVAQTK